MTTTTRPGILYFDTEAEALAALAGDDRTRLPLRWCRQDLEAADVGAVTRVALTQAHLAGDAELAELGEELVRLVRERGRHRLVLEVSAIDLPTSALIGLYIRLLRATCEVGGAVAMCGVSEFHRDVLNVCGLGAA